MTTKNGIEYAGVWELDGKFFTLAESSVTDWDTVWKGTELWNEDGRGYIEVEYHNPAPHWTEPKYRTTNEIRKCICEMMTKEFVAIRMILFDGNPSREYDTVLNIVQFDDMDGMRLRYLYGYDIDRIATDWGGKLMSLEGITV